MKIIRFLPSLVLIAGTMHSMNAWSNEKNTNESDAMQITTHINNLTGITCDKSGQSCIAVGFKPKTNAMEHVVSKTLNGGITWSKDYNLPHAENEDPKLKDFSNGHIFMTIRCHHAGQECLIAGTTSINQRTSIIIYASHDGGESWDMSKNIPLSLETQIISIEEGIPLHLKCNSKYNTCILGVNTVQQNKFIARMYYLKNDNEKWHTTPSLNLPSNSLSGVILNDFDCDQSGLFCTALSQVPDIEASLLDQIIHGKSKTLTYIYSSHDGGQTWSDPKSLKVTHQDNLNLMQSNIEILSIISCDATGLSCIALGKPYLVKANKTLSTSTYSIIEKKTHSYLTKNGGISWIDTSEIMDQNSKQNNIFNAIECDESNRFCAAVGLEYQTNTQKGTDEFLPIIYTTIDSGHSWQRKAYSPIGESLDFFIDVFCSDDAALCHAVGVDLIELFNINNEHS